jgi:hypothetical protein
MPVPDAPFNSAMHGEHADEICTRPPYRLCIHETTYANRKTGSFGDLRSVSSRAMKPLPHAIYGMDGTDRPLVLPGTVLMRAEIDAPFFLETRSDGKRHPRRRFLELAVDRLVEITWVTGADGRRARDRGLR